MNNILTSYKEVEGKEEMTYDCDGKHARLLLRADAMLGTCIVE